MKRKILMFLICGGLVLGLTTGCGNDQKENEKIDNNQSSQKENVNNNYEIQSGARYTWSNDSVGIQIDLLKNNEVVYSSRTKSGNFEEYYGNYTIDKNSLTITLNEIYGDNGNEPYNDIKTYTIISNTEFKDKDNNTYSFKTTLDK